MVFASSSTLPAAISLGLAFIPITDKLTYKNYRSWKAQALSTIKGAQAERYIQPSATPPSQTITTKNADGKEESKPNPDYAVWVAQDQQVLSYLLSGLSAEILGQVNSETTAAGAWAAIESRFAAQSSARVIATRMALTTASKGTSTIAEYFGKMKALADEMAAAGKKLEDDELVSYILTGLDESFDSVVSGVSLRTEPISVSELFTQLVSHEQRIDMRSGGSHSSANIVARSGRDGGHQHQHQQSTRGHGGRPRGGGFHRGGPPGHGGARAPCTTCGRTHGPNFRHGVFCQVCKKEGHEADRCFKRFDQNYTASPPPRSASSATTSYGVDTNWYFDTRATDHISGELDKLTVCDRYNGSDQVHAANGSGMEISHIGHGILHSPSRNLNLK